MDPIHISDALGLILVSWLLAAALLTWHWVFCLLRRTNSWRHTLRLAYRYALLATALFYADIVYFGVLPRIH